MNNSSYWVRECEPEILDKYYTELLIESGFCVLNKAEHHFTPMGWTALYLLSESHFAIHTFPEENKTYVEISSCIDEPYLKFMKLEKNNDKIVR